MDQPGELTVWVGISLGVYLAVCVAVGRVSSARGGRLAQWLAWWRGWRPAPLVSLLARLTYFVGFPYAALLNGSMDLRSLGLIGGEAWSVVGTALVLSSIAGIALALSWWRWLRTATLNTAPTSHRVGSLELALVALVEALFLQAHLGFYRSLFILVLGSYYGVFAGFVLFAAEWLAGAALSSDWQSPDIWENGLSAAGIIWLTSLLFLATNSLWLCIIVHAGVRWGLLVFQELTSRRTVSLS